MHGLMKGVLITRLFYIFADVILVGLSGSTLRHNKKRTKYENRNHFRNKRIRKSVECFLICSNNKKQGYEVQLFLMGEAVECEGLVHEKYNVSEQWGKFEKEGGIILACGTCLKSRQLDDNTNCPISTMNDCLDMVIWADKTVTFY